MQATPDAAAELHASIELILSLWEELQTQSDVLANERQRYAEFFEYAPDAYLVTEMQGEIREANRAARELLGANQDQLDGASLLAFVSEAERIEFRAFLVAARGQPDGEALQWAGSVCTRAGRALPAELRVRSIKVRRKNADGLCWLIRRT
jgi:PAS domain S-box-containing protein